MRFSGKVGNGPRNKGLNFGGEPHPNRDTVIRRALAEVCTVTVLLVDTISALHRLIFHIFIISHVVFDLEECLLPTYTPLVLGIFGWIRFVRPADHWRAENNRQLEVVHSTTVRHWHPVTSPIIITIIRQPSVHVVPTTSTILIPHVTVNFYLWSSHLNLT